MFLELLRHPWPWYIAGPLIGLAVPALLIAGNKALGISSSLRHICAACAPANIPFLNYDWKKESWNLFFAAGILVGGFIAGYLLRAPDPVNISAKTSEQLAELGIQQQTGMLPKEVFSWQSLTMPDGYIIGGFIFGIGWAFTGACPGPLYAQLGSGVTVTLITILSALAGTWTYSLLRPKLPH